MEGVTRTESPLSRGLFSPPAFAIFAIFREKCSIKRCSENNKNYQGATRPYYVTDMVKGGTGDQALNYLRRASNHLCHLYHLSTAEHSHVLLIDLVPDLPRHVAQGADRGSDALQLLLLVTGHQTLLQQHRVAARPRRWGLVVVGAQQRLATVKE